MYSKQTAVSDGTLTNVLINFDFISREEINVFVNDVPNGSPWVWGSGNQIVFVSGPLSNGTVVTITRSTKLNGLIHDFSSGAAFTAQTLDEDLLQVLHIAQEAVEGGIDASPSDLRSDLANTTPGNGTDLVGYDRDGIAITLTQALDDIRASAAANVVRTVDTVADMRALPASDHSTVITRGHDAVNDGGAGVYYYDSADTTSADNNGTVINSGTTRRKLLHNGTINIAQWGNSLSSAIDNMPAGGHLVLNAGTYLANIAKTRSNLKISGKGMPYYNVGNTGLVGGTIINGMLSLCGDNLHIESLGIDCGSTVCAAINGGTPMDALAILDPTRTIRNQITVRDVTTLCKDPTSAVHNFLLEGLHNSHFTNLVARNGHWGCVMKTTNSSADGIKAYSCSQAGYTFKADSGVAGTPALRSVVSNVIVDNSGYMTATQGVLLYAATSSLLGLDMSNVQTRGGAIGTTLLCDSRAVNINLLSDVKLSNFLIEGATNLGFKTFGAINRVLVDNMVISGTASNKSIEVGSDCLGITFNNVTASAPAADPLNVNLAGRFVVSNLVSCVGGDFGTPSGINIAPEGANLFKMGKYLGTLGLNGVQTYTPSWTNLTVVLGGGTVTHTGSFRIDGPYIDLEAQIATTGAATTQSTASTTRIDNLPFAAVRNDTCTVISGTVSDGGVGLVQTGGQNCFTPSWPAASGTRVVRTRYRFQL